MLKIRLQRLGRKNDPHFKLIVTPEAYKPKTHKFIEDLGFYDAKSGRRAFKAERVKYWLSMGAQTSPTVYNFLVTDGVLSGKKKNVLPRKSITKAKKEAKTK